MFLKGDNVAKDMQVDKEHFRSEMRRIFGERKPSKPGKYYWVDGKMVHEDDYVRPRKTRAPSCRMREPGWDVEVHRSTENMKAKEGDLVRTEKGYRTLCP